MARWSRSTRGRPLAVVPPTRLTCPRRSTVYAMRDLDKLHRDGRPARRRDRDLRGRAARHPAAVDQDARRSTGCSGWSRSSVPTAVEQACARALECEAIDVGLIARIMARAAEATRPHPPGPWSRRPAGSPATRTSSPSCREAEPMTAPTTATAVDPGAQGAAAAGQARQEPRHPARAAHPGRTSKLSHAEFLELVLADEVARRDRPVRDVAGPDRQARPGHDPRSLGRRRRRHLRPATSGPS